MEATMDTFQVKLWLRENSQPIVYAALATYEKGSFYCIVYLDGTGVRQVRKFPVASIWASEEEYKHVGWTPTAAARKG
jgi:hypothetical protein